MHLGDVRQPRDYSLSTDTTMGDIERVPLNAPLEGELGRHMAKRCQCKYCTDSTESQRENCEMINTPAKRLQCTIMNKCCTSIACPFKKGHPSRGKCGRTLCRARGSQRGAHGAESSQELTPCVRWPKSTCDSSRGNKKYNTLTRKLARYCTQ